MENTDGDIRQLVSIWISSFGDAVANGEGDSFQSLFLKDCYWRNICGITWSFGTVIGPAAIEHRLLEAAQASSARNFRLSATRSVPRTRKFGGRDVIECVFDFDSSGGQGVGVVRLVADPHSELGSRAWSIMTALEKPDFGEAAVPADKVQGADHALSLDAPNWLDHRNAEIAFENRDPEVLVVGGGHAGITSGVELKQLGVDTLIIDKEKRIGDNWRLRYHSLKLHNRTGVNHLPYLPFPKNWPDYIPKDKVANWLEFYVDAMELNFWTETEFLGAEYDEAAGHWIARVRRQDGSVREMHPKHIILATSVSGTPKLPKVPTLDQFTKTVLHSSQFENGAQWKGKAVVVMGTGTSAHDICQNLEANGADVTMVQRSPTLIVNIDPSAQLYDGSYLGDGPPVEDRDLMNSSVPFALVKREHQEVTKKVRQLDKPLLDRLNKVGFRLDFGPDDSGWPLKFRTRGGGYYFNVGCSELIAEGKVKLIQYSDIQWFKTDGIAMKDGREVKADLIVLATGYETQEYMVGELFSAEVVDNVGQVWGFDDETHELRNMWVQTGQPGLWFTGGAFSQCRIYSKYLAMQIKAIEMGLMPRKKARRLPARAA